MLPCLCRAQSLGLGVPAGSLAGVGTLLLREACSTERSAVSSSSSSSSTVSHSKHLSHVLLPHACSANLGTRQRVSHKESVFSDETQKIGEKKTELAEMTVTVT